MLADVEAPLPRRSRPHLSHRLLHGRRRRPVARSDPSRRVGRRRSGLLLPLSGAVRTGRQRSSICRCASTTASFDPIVPVEISRAWQRRLLDLGVHVDYLEYPGIRHNAWDLAYTATTPSSTGSPTHAAIPARTGPFRHPRLPIRGRLLGHHRRPDARHARLHRRRVDREKHALKVATENLDAFTVRWRSRRPPLSSQPSTAPRLRAKPRRDSFLPQSFGPAGSRGASLHQGKHPGARRPHCPRPSPRQIYVYGTAGAPLPTRARGPPTGRRDRRRNGPSPRAAALPQLPRQGRYRASPPTTSANRQPRSVRHQRTNSVIARLAPATPAGSAARRRRLRPPLRRARTAGITS